MSAAYVDRTLVVDAWRAAATSLGCMKDRRRIPKVWTRMIATKDRPCSECEDTIPEGSVYFRDKRANLWCLECREYDDNKPPDEPID